MKELASIQQSLKAPKSERNNFGEYNYRNAEGILQAVKPYLAQHECTLVLSDEMVNLGDRYYIRATATLKNAAGETESATAWAREEFEKKKMDAAQITGSASSYARKYAMCGLFAIDATKDPDATNRHGFDEALAQIRTAPDIQALLALWEQNKAFQKFPDFAAACTARKNELGA